MINKEYLRNHAEHRQELQDELQRYELNHGCSYYGKSPSNIDGMPHGQGGVGNNTFGKVEQDVDTEKNIKELEYLVNEEQKAIEAVLTLFSRANQKAVIRYKYYQCLDWEDVAFYMYGNKTDYLDKQNYYKQKAQKVHGAALENMLRLQRTNTDT